MAGEKEDYSKIVCELRNSFNAGKTRPLSFRKAQLKSLRKMFEEKASEFMTAVDSDLRKSSLECQISELNVLKNDIDVILDNIDEWAKPKEVPRSSLTVFDKPRVYNDPFGVVLVMGAWNYPVQLPLMPLAGAIAAGNCVLVKPSEVSSATATALEKLLPLYLDNDCFKVVNGGIAETTKLLEQRFDYIFYTGSTPVGKIVREAANKHLTPTTLELGGKSPCFLDETVDMDIAVRRLVWGKLLNFGQTCVAPDYLLCTKSVQETFLKKAKEVIHEFYGENPKNSPDLGRIVNQRHFNRLKDLISDGTAVIGGNCDESENWIEPTILIDVEPKSKIMRDEIFGPILPIINVQSIYEAVHFINEREKPLALYVFSNCQKTQECFINETSSGSMCINDAVVQLTINGLPFGGVGHSGMGSYHGKYSYDIFNHKKSCFIRSYNKIAELVGKNRYPPYTEKKKNTLTLMLKERNLPSLRPLGYLFAFGLGALAFYAGQAIYHAQENKS